jgi:hypothetical protein
MLKKTFNGMLAVGLVVALGASPAPADEIANSVTEYSGSQTQDNWEYGKYDAPYSTTGVAPGTFSQLGYWDGSYWWDSAPSTTPRLSPTWGQTYNTAPAVRRYTAEKTGFMQLSGEYELLQSNAAADARMFLNGRRIWGQTNPAYGSSLTYNFGVPVTAGDTIDLVVALRSNQPHAKFTLQVDDKSPRTVVADSYNDFSLSGQGHADSSGLGQWHYGHFWTPGAGDFTSGGWTPNVGGGYYEYTGQYEDDTVGLTVCSYGAQPGKIYVMRSAARQWTSGVSGDLYFDGAAFPRRWDASARAYARIYHNGSVVWDTGFEINSRSYSSNFSFMVEDVQVGDTFLFEMAPVQDKSSTWLPNDFFVTITQEGAAAAAIPEPAGLGLLGIGLAGLIRRRKRS